MSVIRIPRRSSSVFIAPQPEKFWNTIGIYPEALNRRGKIEEFEAGVRSALMRLGPGNLRLLCEESRIPCVTDATESAITDMLIGASDSHSLIHLLEFLKRRTPSVDLVFETSKRQSRASVATLESLSRNGKPEKLKPFTKLLLLFKKNPASIREVFYHDLWISRATAFSYTSKGDWPNDLVSRLLDVKKELAKCIRGATRRGVDFVGSHKLADGTVVIAFLREYTPEVTRDFYEGYNVRHRCGFVILGVDEAKKQLHLKLGNSRIALGIERFLGSLFYPVEFRLVQDDVFGGYDPDYVRNALLGVQNQETGVQIVEEAFCRSGLTGSPSLIVKASLLQPSINAALEGLQEIVEVRSPGDLDYITVSFKGKTTCITTEPAKGGAIRLKFENGGWTSELQEEFEEAFLKTFGLPVNRLIDPSPLAMGKVGIIAHLLNVASESHVQPYQKECFDALIQSGYLHTDPQTLWHCPKGICENNLVYLREVDRETCPKCGEEYKECSINAIERDVKAIAGVVGEVLERATGWKLLDDERQFERRSYHPLQSQTQGQQEETICTLFHDRLTVEMRRDFERFSRPILVVQSRTDNRHIYVDEDGIGRLSISYLIAAQEREEDRTRAEALCKQMVDRLLQSYEERVRKAARHSYDVLTGDLSKLSGYQYETEVVNIFRAMFPYTHPLGREGKEEPDGFVCIPDYKDATGIADASSFNWIYDAKHSNKPKGYNLDKDEHRKIVSYINRFRDLRKVLDGKHRKIRAHVLISKQITDRKMRLAAKYVFGENGVKEANRDVRLVLMDQDFLLRLFDWVSRNSQEVQGRRPYFYELVVKLLSRDPQNGYVHLTAEDADKLCVELLKYDVVHMRIDANRLEESLDAS